MVNKKSTTNTKYFTPIEKVSKDKQKLISIIKYKSEYKVANELKKKHYKESNVYEERKRSHD